MLSPPSSGPSPERAASTTPGTSVSGRRGRRTERCPLCGSSKARCKCGAETSQFRVIRQQQTQTLPVAAARVSRAVPRTAGDNITLDLIGSMEDLNLQHWWLQLIPSRIGWNNAVDSAALLLCKARNFRMGNDENKPELEESAMQSYGLTLRLLQSALEDPALAATDATLATVALVSLFEVVLSPLRDTQCLLTNWHVAGLTAILAARPADHQSSELTRGVLCGMYDFTFIYAALIGQPSPFEDQRWIALEPAVLSPQSQACYKLARLRHRSSLQVPRLITYVRSIREGTATLDIPTTATRLAKHLLSLVDEPSETALLHQVRIVRSTSFADAVAAPSSLEFSNLAEFRDAVLYWMFRLMVLNLSLRLSTLIPLITTSPFNTPELRQAQTRMISNLLMCWQYAQRHGLFATADMSQAYISVWTALGDNDPAVFKGKPVVSVKQWLLPKIRHPFITWTREATGEEVQVASEVLEGGSLSAFHDLVRSKGTACV